LDYSISKLEKTLEDFLREPTPSDFTWNDLLKIMSSLNYDLLKKKGSRRQFYNTGTGHVLSCHKPHGDGILGRSLLEQIRDALIERGVL